MPQAFYQAGQRRYAYQLTDEEYREIQQYTRTDRHHILSAINNEPVFLKISPRGRKFVSHYPNGEHTTDKESSEHFNTKTRVYDSLRAAGYRAEMEHLIPLNDEGDYIIADTVCFFPEEHIPPLAIEVQNSAQTPEEYVSRTTKYHQAGYGVIWLQRRAFNWENLSKYPALPVDVVTPTECSDDNYLDIDWSDSRNPEIPFDDVLTAVCAWHRDLHTLTHDSTPLRAIKNAHSGDVLVVDTRMSEDQDDYAPGDLAGDMCKRVATNIPSIRRAVVTTLDTYTTSMESFEHPAHISPLSNPKALAVRSEDGEWAWVCDGLPHHPNAYPAMSIIGRNFLTTGATFSETLPLAENATYRNTSCRFEQSGRKSFNHVALAAPTAFRIVSVSQLEETTTFITTARYRVSAMVMPLAHNPFREPQETRVNIHVTSREFATRYLHRGAIVSFAAQVSTGWANESRGSFSPKNTPYATMKHSLLCPTPPMGDL